MGPTAPTNGKAETQQDARAGVEVSVIIPMRNAASTILEQLDALAANDPDVTWEVVVADNGSRDGSGALVAQRAATFPVPLRLVDASATVGGGCGAQRCGAREPRRQARVL